jgi:pyruvate dehydrogenase E2 component (dihydrolipoamide acetyltransferase)
MAENIYLPRLGQTMTEGTIVRWLVGDGTNVQKGDEVYTLEYDKATVNIESPGSGKIKILVKEGETVPVSSVVAVVMGEDEGEVPEILVKTPDENKSPELEIKASHMAKKLAREYGINLSDVKASDPSGRITREDVIRYREALQGSKPEGIKTSKQDTVQDNGQDIKNVPLTGMRKVIARRMVQSAFTAPHVTYTTDVDMSEISRLRDQLNEEMAEQKIKLSYTDLIIKVVARALEKCSDINVQLKEESIEYVKQINIGMAVAVDKGLIVPVIRDADKLSLEDIAVKTRELAEKARKNILKPDEIAGGTFTVTNLGMYGVDVFTPIINQPESAILGVGRIVEKAVVSPTRELIIKPMMVLSLSADHRVIDGALAARFLNEVKKLLEKPYGLLRK